MQDVGGRERFGDSALERASELLRHVVIRCAWDAEAGVRFVRESDVPGLATEAPSLDVLRQKLPGMIQNLLDVEATTDIEVDLIAYAHDRMRVEAA